VGIVLKSARELVYMRAAGKIVAQTLLRLRDAVRPGVSTLDLDRLAHESVTKAGAKAAFLGYRGYPASLCASINDEIVHGIPSRDRILQEGDIVSLDFGAIYEGYVGDSAITVPVGKVSDEAARLLQVTEEALEKGIAQALASNYLHDVSAAIQKHAEAAGFSVVRKYVGHGIGRAMHEPPEVPNFVEPGRRPAVRLRPGTVLAIEPMVNTGTEKTLELNDGWTVKTADGGLSAHFEHTVAITNGEPEVLTRRTE
jgi:methionyl aminopeptidase